MESPTAAEKSIYLCMLLGQGEYNWYAISSETPQDQDLEPAIHGSGPNATFDAAAAVGFKIYLFGGRPWVFKEFYRVLALGKAQTSVFHIDTSSPPGTTGWIETEPLMKHPRSLFHAVPVNDKQVFLFLGHRRHLDCEIYDIERRESTLFELPEDPNMGNLTSHAVVEGGEKIFLFSSLEDRLFCFDVETKSHQVVANMKELDVGVVSSITVSDGILYVAGYNLPGCVMAFDLSRFPPVLAAKPSEINGLVGNQDYLPVPNLPRATGLHVVEVAKDTLALLWGRGCGIDFEVFCTRIHISKDEFNYAGQRIFKATSLTSAAYRVKGCSLKSVLPVNTTWILQKENKDNSNNKGNKGKKNQKDTPER